MVPAATMTLAGTIAFRLVFCSGTTAPPAGADPLNTILPADVPHPPITVVGVRYSCVSFGGTTVSVFVTVTRPYVAEIRTSVGCDTTAGMMLKVRVLVQLGTTNVAGTGAISGRLLVMRTTASPAGACPVSVTFAAETFPPGRLAGVSANVDRAIARLASETLSLALLRSEHRS